MRYLAILGRQPEISLAELEAVAGSSYRLVKMHHSENGAVLVFDAKELEIERLGGTIKLAQKIDLAPLEYLRSLPDGKITLGVSDCSKKATRKTAATEALKLKKILVRHGRSVRVVENKEAMLTTATSLHNGLSGKNGRKVEFIKLEEDWYRVVGVQDIDAYARRDQARPARDAKVGMLPPKLAQILINLCGELNDGARILDPFCGTGVVLQEALLMGYRAYGTDISERMVEYSNRNLSWITDSFSRLSATSSDSPIDAQYQRESLTQSRFQVSLGDATTYQWEQPIDAVACEGYLGKPMSQVPSMITLKTEQQECKAIIVGFLKNLVGQIKVGTPVVIAAPAWLRDNGSYSRLNIIDEIENMGYNVSNKTREGLIYARVGQVVARDIIILRKK